MARIELCNITKNFGATCALDDISLDIADNEFLVLFGPAGAGKTTLLKCIAGIENPQDGLVKIDGEIVNRVEPDERNISMVFENYALYPNKTVYENIASPMRSKRYRQDDQYIYEAIQKVTKMMKIDGLLDRKPSQLSNGQRQRVALGRCLVRTPNVFLMDEPLAHLDAKLRHFMRGELKEMQNAFNTTTIYVTHDYVEAMSLADRVVVLNEGKIEQIGSAQEMYYQPCNTFIAKLFGEPEINLFAARIVSRDGKIYLATLEHLFPLEKKVAKSLVDQNIENVIVGIRGRDISFSFTPQGDGWVNGSVYVNEPIGNKVIMTVIIDGEQIRIVAPNMTRAEIDQMVYLRFHLQYALFFDQESERLVAVGGGDQAVAEAELEG